MPDHLPTKGKFLDHEDQCQLLLAFDQEGLVSSSVIMQIYHDQVFSFSQGKNQERNIHEKNVVAEFKSFAEFNLYIEKILEKLDRPFGFILPVHEYNLQIEKCPNIEAFAHLFANFGQRINNPSYTGERSSFFKKLFE
jgi:hypothetical protein